MIALVSMVSMVLVFGMQGPGDGLRLYQAGDFAGAVDAFRGAVTAQPESPELLYDLALAEWRAGHLPAAEEAAERYAAAPGGGRVDLHRGLLGNIRFAEAEALAARVAAPASPPLTTPPAGGNPTPAAQPPDPVDLLEQAVTKAKTARDEFVRAAAAPQAGVELARNTERTLRLLADLEKKLEAAKKQREEQQQQDQNNQKNDDKKSDDKKSDDQKDDAKNKKSGDPKNEAKDPKDDQKDGDKQDHDKQDQQPPDKPPDQKQDGDKNQQQSEPKPGEGEERPEPKPPEPSKDPAKNAPDQQSKDAPAQPPQDDKQGEERPEPKPADQAEGHKVAGEPRSDAPGEQVQPTELSPEQTQRLMEELQHLDARLRQLRAQARGGRKPVERDW